MCIRLFSHMYVYIYTKIYVHEIWVILVSLFQLSEVSLQCAYVSFHISMCIFIQKSMYTRVGAYSLVSFSFLRSLFSVHTSLLTYAEPK